MPLFQCPKCEKQYLVPLALCEAFLENTPIVKPDGSAESVFVLPCPDCMSQKIHVVEGDLLDQDVDVIVNAWNRNIIPWWLLLPQGVSGAIKKRGGTGPFKELRETWSDSVGRGRADLGGPTAVQGDHPRRRDQHVVAGVGAVDPRFRSKCHAPRRREGISVDCLAH